MSNFEQRGTIVSRIADFSQGLLRSTLFGARVTSNPQQRLLDDAEKILNSWTSKGSVKEYTTSAGVTDVYAMEALNEAFRKRASDEGVVIQPSRAEVIHAGDLAWYANLSERYSDLCDTRDYRTERSARICGVISNTQGASPDQQRLVLNRQGFVASDPRDLAIAAAIEWILHERDLFEGYLIRTWVPGFVLDNRDGCVVVREENSDFLERRVVAAFGSPIIADE